MVEEVARFWMGGVMGLYRRQLRPILPVEQGERDFDSILFGYEYRGISLMSCLPVSGELHAIRHSCCEVKESRSQ